MKLKVNTKAPNFKLPSTSKDDYLNTFFDAYWKNNLDLSSEREFSELLGSLKIDSKIFFVIIDRVY